MGVRRGMCGGVDRRPYGRDVVPSTAYAARGFTDLEEFQTQPIHPPALKVFLQPNLRYA
jgi:hypothetical protein